VIGALRHRQPDGQALRITELLERDIAHVGALHEAADLVERRGCGEGRLDHHAADEIDAEVEPAHRDQCNGRNRQQRSDRKRPEADADEADIGVVGDELDQAHGILAVRC